jgi:hypothetical protein
VIAYHSGRAREGAVVLIPREAAADPAAIAARVTQAVALPWITAAPLATVVDRPGVLLIRVDPAEDPLRGPDANVVADLNATAHDINAFSKVTADPGGIVRQWTPELLAPVALNVIPAQARTNQAVGVVDEARTLLESFGPIRGSEMTMISATSELPVVIENSSPMPLHFSVALTTSARALVTDGAVDVELEPDSQVTVRVPVHAIANGDVDVTVHLVNADGDEVGNASTFRVRVHAEWENISTGILLAVVGLLLVLGVVRAILRRRKGGAATESPEP